MESADSCKGSWPLGEEWRIETKVWMIGLRIAYCEFSSRFFQKSRDLGYVFIFCVDVWTLKVMT